MAEVIPTPLPEVADRYTIAKLKLERLPSDEADPDELRRQVNFYLGGLDTDDTELMAMVDDLYEINGLIWDAEHEIRKGQDENLGLDEIGRRALRIRDLNRRRIRIKNRIVELTGDGFKDVKMNYADDSSG